MGNDSSLIRKCQVSPTPRYSAAEWSLYDANHTNQRYSLMVFNEDFYFNDITRWKHIRHPNLVKCYEAGLNKTGKKCILLEPVEPIQPQINKMHSSRILSGLYNIGEVLAFLHQKCGLSVNNLSVNSIFISQKDCDEQWKLGSLYWYSSLDTDSEEFFKQLLQFHHVYNSINVLPIEDREMRTHQLIRSSKLVHRRDSHSFTELLQNLLVKSSDSNLDSVILKVKEFITECNAKSPQSRLRMDEILLNKIFVNCSFLQMRQFFLNFSTYNSFEKERFFETFIDRLRTLPSELLIVQIFKMIVTSRVIMSDMFIYNNVMPYFLIPISNINSHSFGEDSSQIEQVKQNFILTNSESISLRPLLTESTYQEHIIPHICNLFCVHDFKIRILLLQYLSHFANLIPKNHLRKVILPQILLGIKDSDSFLVSLTFRSLATLVEIFDVVTVLGGSKRAKIFTTEAPRNGTLLNTKARAPKSDERDDVSIKSIASSNSSSLNFLSYKLQSAPSAERTSPDGNENCAGSNEHKDLSQLNSSMNNLNLVEDDDEWPEWENGEDSLSHQFETAVQSYTSTEALNSGVRIKNPQKDNKILDNNKHIHNNEKCLAKDNLQTFDIKEIDFHQSKAEIDNLFLEMEPVLDFKKTIILPVLKDENAKESSIVNNDNLFVFQATEGHVDDSAWENDDDLDLEIDLSNEKDDSSIKINKESEFFSSQV